MDVCVVGLIYVECEVPAEAALVEPGIERFVARIPLGLGGALNAASVLSRLGRGVELVFPAGEGPGDAVVRWALERLPLLARPFPARDDPAVSLVFRTPHERAFVTAASFDALRGCPPLPRARWLHVPGLFEAQHLFPRLEEARAQGSRLSLSASWAPEAFGWLRTLEGAPFDQLVLNEKEAHAVAGTPERAIEALAGAARDIIVTRGAHGAAGRIDGAAVSCAAAPAPAARDPTGAGDAFAAALLAARLEGRAPADALRFASKVAARMLTLTGGVAFAEDIFTDLEESP